MEEIERSYSCKTQEEKLWQRQRVMVRCKSFSLTHRPVVCAIHGIFNEKLPDISQKALCPGRKLFVNIRNQEEENCMLGIQSCW